MKSIVLSIALLTFVFQVASGSSGRTYFVKSTYWGPEPSCSGTLTESAAYFTGFCIPQQFGSNTTYYEKLECTSGQIIFHKYKDAACNQKISQDAQHLGCNHGTKFSCEDNLPQSKETDRVRVYYNEPNCVQSPFQVTFYFGEAPADSGCTIGICRGITQSLSYRDGCGLNFNLDTFGKTRTGSNAGTIIIAVAIVLVFLAILGVGAAFFYKRHLDRKDSERRVYMAEEEDDEEL